MHTPLEPIVSLAESTGSSLTLHTASQMPSVVRTEIARLLGWPENRVRVKTALLGGGFGAKTYIKVEALVAVCALLTRLPAKISLSLEEQFYTINKHANTLRLKSGVMKDAATDAVLERLAERMNWKAPFDRGNGTIRRGRGIAIGFKASISNTTSVAIVNVYGDGSCSVCCNTVDMGQGSDTAMAQIAGETLNMPAETIRVVHADTDVTPYDMGTLGSRSTFHMGQAVKVAAEDARDKLLALAAELGLSAETTPINPQIVASQLSGAATMQFGCTMSEGIEFDAGQVTNASLADYKIPGIRDIPAIMVNEIVEARQHTGPCGAKGVGETGTFGVSPAITNAIHDAAGVRITRLPVTPESVSRAIRARNDDLAAFIDGADVATVENLAPAGKLSRSARTHSARRATSSEFSVFFPRRSCVPVKRISRSLAPRLFLFFSATLAAKPQKAGKSIVSN